MNIFNAGAGGGAGVLIRRRLETHARLCETRRGPSGGIDCQRKTKGWARAPRLFACTDAWWRVADHGLLAEQDLPVAESHFGPGRGSNGGFWSQKVENAIFQKGID